MAELRESDPDAAQGQSSALYRLPQRAAHIVGRDEAIEEIGQNTLSRRFVSIVGPGGIGKTTVAVAAANSLLEAFDGVVCLVELSAIDDPQLVDSSLAAAFGLPIPSGDPIARLISHLAGKRTLLVLDCCERLAARIAALAEQLLDALPALHILVTSREVLNAKGEFILRLAPLESPPDTPAIAARTAISFPAVQLFAHRIANSGLTITDEIASSVANMCRKLGGLPLAIELVAAQVGDHGVRETAALLDSQFALRWPGRRTAPTRHQTLNATLDWSYNLLTKSEQHVLRQIAVFAGGFTIDAASAVAMSNDAPASEVARIVAALFAKSLISTDGGERYRLLDATRSYASLKLTDRAEQQALRRRHAQYFSGWLQSTAADEHIVRREMRRMRPETENVRAALDWAFSAEGDPALAIGLAIRSAPLWLGQALFTECHDWMVKARDAFSQEGNIATRERLSIEMALASSELFSVGLSEESAETWKRAADLAERLGDPAAQLNCLTMLFAWELRETWYGKALTTAHRYARVAEATAERGPISMANWMIGHAQHQLGRLAPSREHLERALEGDDDEFRAAQIAATGYDRRIDGLAILSNTLWTLGRFGEARKLGAQAIAEARALGLASPFGVAMIWVGLNNHLSATDFEGLERDMAELVDHGRTHTLISEEGFGLCILGLCQARRDACASATASVTEGLRLLTDAHMLSFNPIILAHLAEAALKGGRRKEARDLLERLTREDRNTEHWCTPELLRVRACLALAEGEEEAGERLLTDAFAMADKHQALAWQIKIATSFAQLRMTQGRPAEARRFLEPLCNAVADQPDAADVRAARHLLGDICRKSASH